MALPPHQPFEFYALVRGGGNGINAQLPEFVPRVAAAVVAPSLDCLHSLHLLPSAILVFHVVHDGLVGFVAIAPAQLVFLRSEARSQISFFHTQLVMQNMPIIFAGIPFATGHTIFSRIIQNVRLRFIYRVMVRRHRHRSRTDQPDSTESSRWAGGGRQ
ncbi:hypothetical protein GUJ93_ZPchr0012g21478 [Zizania palustris]|uniref:Uncharacterized protein n=1 Tax=Zizania palustris TaxID=103762 RepID=A0A8J5WY66_ZIZPA|nr:hypothetical protein GUJ93_ZPchr0012g21478 [Zizania palustris]